MRNDSVIALAMTWDGSRLPTRTLPPRARAFLNGKSRMVFNARNAAKLFADDRVKEIRVCWVPQLRGGDDVLCSPFPLSKRLAFRATQTTPFGDVLGVVYRRT